MTTSCKRSWTSSTAGTAPKPWGCKKMLSPRLNALQSATSRSGADPRTSANAKTTQGAVQSTQNGMTGSIGALAGGRGRPAAVDPGQDDEQHQRRDRDQAC